MTLTDLLAKLKSNDQRDALAREVSRNIAQPVIRSMYPSRSRGQMQKEFEQVYTLGYNARDKQVELLVALCEKSIALLKDFAEYDDTLDGMVAWTMRKQAKEFLDKELIDLANQLRGGE